MAVLTAVGATASKPSATALAAVRPLAVCGGVSGTLRCLLLQQLATADTLVTPDTVYKMYGVTQQQSCV